VDGIKATTLKETTKMKRLIAGLALSLLGTVASAQNIATCSDPKGHAYYPAKGVSKKADSRWTKDAITGGKVTLIKVGDRKLDILFVDTSNTIQSTIGTGGLVVPLRITNNDIAVLVNYGDSTEIYNFWKTTDGRHEFSMIQNKGGESVMVPKSSVLVGTCSAINFSAAR
jgi:hypothetical protein